MIRKVHIFNPDNFHPYIGTLYEGMVWCIAKWTKGQQIPNMAVFAMKPYLFNVLFKGKIFIPTFVNMSPDW